ncbi:MAG: magnesium chelatase [Candidatus Chisholmbacteria bacterium RIFCSPHIGHO2_01_FULL_49_18]|uniref:Magnesium chelatase n=1 Tax=Candidatus Chisholmbacteria bacterium RIFCSPHIGHO2_01_FULL_49_18 TaxID=1797590 RepID=A0A1G1VML4_9BACT|nr:MAG: magnesium chelatase [Candidatus Chisholmbacteria bacterium RIFCSPHIGHO2_01_FULL_49_18]
MLSKIFSAATVGLSSIPVEVEVDVSATGLPSFTIVGLPDKAVEESKERVRSAIKNSGAEFPDRRITVNLAPADLPKEGPAYDVSIALGILVASGQVGADLNKSLVFGELSLDGSLRHTNGTLPLVLLAQEKNFVEVFLPAVNAEEAAIVGGVNIYPVKNIRQLVEHLMNIHQIELQEHLEFNSLKSEVDFIFDMADIAGQEHAKRALEIAAAGGHNLFMHGVPGAGKTMLARAFASILPELSKEEALEVTKIYSISGNLPQGESIIKYRPFRSPHHTTSRIGLIGGGSRPKPGEISLAHRGVLFLDEFPEFPRHVLESLRQPMEDGIVQISRAVGTMHYPARFTLIAAANPCPCGYYGSQKKQCTCLPGSISRYRKKLSGPILDRIDLHVEVPEVKLKKLTAEKLDGERSDVIRKRVQAACARQRTRFRDGKILSNAEMNSREVRELCLLDATSKSLLTSATAQMGLTARSYFKIIKIARTIADLSGEKEIAANHLAEALQYRPKDVDL